MLFNSYEFLCFLPIVFLLYWFVFRTRKRQNLLIVLASYVFYGWWDWRFLLLIAFTSLCSYGSGLLMARQEGHHQVQKIINAANIVVNLMILGVFKYFNFFKANIDALFRTFGWQLDWITMDIILPVGISFYTFQALSYTIDVYRKRILPTRDAVEFFAYISFFPQLVAGPIERATCLLPQFQQPRHFDYAEAADGMRQMLWGFLKKMVIADNCAAIVNTYWDRYHQMPGLMLFLVGVAFAFQIYCDFSGYSDIAIGCARLFGIRLMRNFNFPYFSRSISEFWRRWHISLMTWFRDYIYIPLGGNRCGRWNTVRNTLIVFFVSGLWHGADWTFIAWGMYHAVLMVIFSLPGRNVKQKDIVAAGKVRPSAKEALQMFATFFFVIIGWIIFRAENMAQAAGYLHAMCTNRCFALSEMHGKKYLAAGILLLAVEWFQRDKQHALQFAESSLPGRSVIVRYGLYIVLLMIICMFAGSQSEFIYFQF